MRCIFSLLEGKDIIDITNQFIDYVDEWYISEVEFTKELLESEEIIFITSTNQRKHVLTYHSLQHKKPFQQHTKIVTMMIIY